MSIIAASVIATGCGSGKTSAIVSSFEGGTLLDESGINVIDLKGDWHQMGRQYGNLAKGFLDDILSYLDAKLVGETDNKAQAYAIADSLFMNYPVYLKDFFDGMEETSGIPLEDLKLCNAVEYVEGCFFCSGIAAWGAYSKDKLVFGRNYDAGNYSEVCRDLVLTVYHPENRLSAATFGYAGEIYCINGLNEKGIFIELNNGMPSAGWDIDWSMIPGTTSLFELLLSAESLQDVERFFANSISPASFSIGVSDKSEAMVYEWCHEGAKRGDVTTPVGLVVNTNHYSNPEWSFPVPSEKESWNSNARRCNLLNFAERTKGRIDVPELKEIMSTSIEDGGPYHNLTRYQIVAVPEDLTLHIKLPCNEEWVEINNLF
ncbi:MAG: hypothetical protein KBT00_05870 [Bacteroidales bacterium]|nr:hypothetical protein [Candidatus Cacconaster merdequi]